MKLQIERAHGTLTAPPSKSALHRRLILNAIAGRLDEPCDPCTDVGVIYEGLRAIQTGDPVSLRDCGAAMRFLIPVSLLFGGASFTGSERLSERPLLPLLNALHAHGADISSDALPLTVSGTLRPGRYIMDGGISSQFFSGLMMTLPFLSGESFLGWTDRLASDGYVALTERILNEHGVVVKREENGYSIPGNQTPAALPLTVEGDWSCAAPMLILGAIAGSVTVTGLDMHSVQPDRAILDVLSHCGSHVSVDCGAVTVSKGTLSGCKFNGDRAPDLVPALAALGCASEGDTVLYRLGRLRLKESDRFDAILRLLASLGADFETENGDTIAIHGHGSIKGGSAEVPPDHRMVMAAAVMSAASAMPVTPSETDSLNKSYPTFLQDFERIGGRIDAI